MCQDCGDLRKAIDLKYFDIEPKKLSVPQNISVSIAFEILEDLKEQLKVCQTNAITRRFISIPHFIKLSVSVSRKLPLLGYVKLPCIANYGSCIYEHICNVYADSLELEHLIVCPRWLKATGIECKCPFKKVSEISSFFPNITV